MLDQHVKILVIDDKRSLSEGGGWVILGTNYGVECHLVVGNTRQEIIGHLEKIFADEPERVFTGTILDIIFRGQARGGIELWEQIEAKGWRDKFGELLVTTKLDSDEVLEFVNEQEAMLNTHLAQKHKEAVFRMFLKRCGLP